VQPNNWFTPAWLTAAYSLADRQTEARKTLAAFSKKYPQYNLARITEIYQQEQFQNPTLQEASARLLIGLGKAGLK
jgi:hypothetical protein